MINPARLRLGRTFFRLAGLLGIVAVVLPFPFFVAGSMPTAAAEPFVRVCNWQPLWEVADSQVGRRMRLKLAQCPPAPGLPWALPK
jgi:hypothetical protein